jgi:hypothetical protein
MQDNNIDPHRLQQQYWNEMVNLKSSASYSRLFRDRQGRWVTALSALKAIASSGAIAGWVIWKQWAFCWAAVIAVAQVADALKDVFPFTQRHKAASELVLTLDRLLIDVQFEWESIFQARYSEDEISERIHQLRKLQLEAVNRYFPHGLDQNKKLLAIARNSAALYFESIYGIH